MAAKQKKQKRRPYYGGGMPKGHKTQKVLDKEAARAALREMVFTQQQPMIEAHIANAIGIKHLMLRDPKTGKFERVQDEAGIDKALKSDGEAVWIYTKDPSPHSFQYLFDQAMDKPTQHVDVDADVKGGIKLTWKTSE